MAATTRETRINLRASDAAKKVIDKAAALTDQSMSRFILDAALTRAETVIADQTRFVLSSAQMRQFQRALDAPLPDPAALKKLLSRKPRWER